MRTTIDAAGRIVVPKPLRDALGLSPGQPLELEARDGALEVRVPDTPMRLEPGRHGLRAVPAEPLPALSAAQVRAVLEQTRR